MIPMADPGSGTGAASFPDPPKGDPGAIAAIARTLSGAGDELHHVGSGLRAASASLALDWQGYAASAYHSSSQGLAAVAHGGSGEFRDCAHAVAGYGTALDHAQSEIKRLRMLWERGPAADDDGDRSRPTGSARRPRPPPPRRGRPAEHPAAQRPDQASGAGREADGYARRAQQVLDDFTHTASGYEQTLAGTRPGTPGTPFGSAVRRARRPSPGFGAPLEPFAGPGAGVVAPDGLSNLTGVIPVGDPWNSPIPGYGFYKDATTPEAVPDDDLTNLIVGVGDAGRRLARRPRRQRPALDRRDLRRGDGRPGGGRAGRDGGP